MAKFLKIDPERFKKWFSLEKALEVYDRDNFLALKRELLDQEFDKDRQIEVWKDYHDLMFKAASKTFNRSDLKLLEQYRTPIIEYDETLRILNSVRGGTHLPAEPISDKEGKVEFSRKYLDQEVNVRLFEHIFNVLVGLEDIRVCAARDCQKLFIPTPQGREQRYHSQNCYWREYRRQERARKRKEQQS